MDADYGSKRRRTGDRDRQQAMEKDNQENQMEKK